MEKQIEEMKKDIHTVLLHNCKYDFCEGVLIGFNEEGIARELCDEGYRKQSDTAQEIFAEIGKILTAKYNSIQVGCHHRMRYGNTDTPQGMKELGELSGVRQVIAEIKAFEKKYMEADNARAD